jgi:predicted O-methyltransferase YrrM
VDVLDSLVIENRTLRRELEVLQQRIRALETSRWHRLNPRRLTHARELAQSRDDSAEAEPAATQPGETEPGGQIARFRAEVVSRGTFTENWFLPVDESSHAWEPLLRELEGRAARLLEIGSFEGMSACFVLWRLADATITCVDTFGGGLEHRVPQTALKGLEQRFDANVALVDATRVRKLVGDSRRMLLDLAEEEERFDFVFVDGSHLGLDVIVDASLAWQLLEPRGTIVFDDYDWAQLGDDALLRPGPAIDAFLSLLAGKYEAVSANEQVVIRKANVPA